MTTRHSHSPAPEPDIDELAHRISYHPDKRLELFRELSPTEQSALLLHLTKHIQYDLISRLDKREIVSILKHLDNDEATDVLQLLPPRRQKPILRDLSDKLRTDIGLLLTFDPQTAAGLMNLDYIQVDASAPIAKVAAQVKVHEMRTGKLPVILVVRRGKLFGFLPGYRLASSKAEETAGQHSKKIETIAYNARLDEVLDLFRRHPHDKIAVLGDAGNVLGIIFSDDILRVLRERESASLYDFAGVSDEESVFDPVRRKVGFRYKWLMINLATTFLAAFTVSLFDDTIAKYVLLAVYMPIVAGMGGNAGTQTLAVLVRGVALKQITFETLWQTLRSELGAGFVNGLINGLLVALIVTFKDGDARIGLILAAAMVINLIVAAAFGTIVPLIMKKLGKDPASSATIFITTATDVFGFLAFLGLATLLLA